MAEIAETGSGFENGMQFKKNRESHPYSGGDNSKLTITQFGGWTTYSKNEPTGQAITGDYRP